MAQKLLRLTKSTARSASCCMNTCTSRGLTICSLATTRSGIWKWQSTPKGVENGKKLATSRMLLRGMLCIHTLITSTEDVETRGLRVRKSQLSLHEVFGSRCRERRPSEDIWLGSQTGRTKIVRTIDRVLSTSCQEFCKPAIIARTAIVPSIAVPT
jgi:hypothetical protein